METGLPQVANQSAFFYESDDRSGQAFVSSSSTSKFRGGELIQIGNNDGIPNVNSPVFGRVGWGAPSMARTAITAINPLNPPYPTCRTFDNPVGFSKTSPINEIDPANYGIGLLPGGAYGFAMPITVQVKNGAGGDGLFCDGFENCPTE